MRGRSHAESLSRKALAQSHKWIIKFAQTCARYGEALTRKPSAGEMAKCGPSARVSHVNLVPVSPVLSSVRRLVVAEPCATGPKGSTSEASDTKHPVHAP
jgi:hypothetical protein